MSIRNDRWSMFKNYMHNELQISKDDIKEWLKEAVKEEAREILKQGRTFDNMVRDILLEKSFGYSKFSEPMNRILKEAITNALKDRLIITIKQDENK